MAGVALSGRPIGDDFHTGSHIRSSLVKSVMNVDLNIDGHNFLFDFFYFVFLFHNVSISSRKSLNLNIL